VEKIWLKSYPEGVPAEVDFSAYPSLLTLLEESFKRNADRSAFECMGQELSYRDLDHQSRNFAAWLQSCGIVPGARVAIMMPNLLQYPIAMVGVLRAGCIVVNVNPQYTPRELQHQLNDSGAEAIVILDHFARTLQAVVANTAVKHVLMASIGEMSAAKPLPAQLVIRDAEKMSPARTMPNHASFGAALSAGAGLPVKQIKIGPDDIAFLQYTGGTTGIAKGAMLLHRNIVANILQTDAWYKPLLAKSPETEVVVVALPLYHIFALTMCALLSAHRGGTALLIPNPRDIPGLIKTLRGRVFHSFPAVNTLHKALLNNPDFSTLDFSKFLLASAGGMPTQEAVAKQWFEVTGIPLLEGYGLSETSPCATSSPVTNKMYSGNIGVPIPSTRVSIRDDANVEVPLGQAGEICIEGPQVMAGYWNRPDETAKVMTPDGYFKSGDVGVMDRDGYIKIIDRKKDMILVSGFNVYPNEIEAVVANLPGVFEVVAVGVSDQQSGEVVKLFIVKRDPALTEADVFRYCKEQLTGYKRPKHIEFRTDLPKSSVGKILRRELRDGTLVPPH